MVKFRAPKLNHLTCTIQWDFVPSQSCATIIAIGIQHNFTTQRRPVPIAHCASLRGSGNTAYLQCTTNGPALGGLLDLTCRTNPSSPVAW